MVCLVRRSDPGSTAATTTSATIADRHVDVEDPAPAQVVHEEAADQRPEHAGHAEYRAEDALVTAALPGRHHVPDDALRPGEQPAAADALHRAGGDQLDHRVGQPGEDRPDQEDHDRGLEELLAAVQVAQLPPQRRGRRRGQQVRGHHPGQMGQPVQVAGDRRQGGGHDRLVQRGQQHAEQQCADDDQHPAAAQRGRPGGCGGGRRPHHAAPPARFSPDLPGPCWAQARRYW